MSASLQQVPRRLWLRGEEREDIDAVVVEVPVALVYNGLSHVVMMATPTDLDDLKHILASLPYSQERSWTCLRHTLQHFQFQNTGQAAGQ